MRLLHVFPCFGAELVGGAERYQYQLSKSLAAMGCEVDVLATTSAGALSTSACASTWPAAYSAGTEHRDGMRIDRFPVARPFPVALGHLVSRAILRRWERETRRWGEMVLGSDGIEDYLYRRARSRPEWYGWMALRTRGPWSPSLLRHLRRVIHRYDLVLTGFMPFALMAQVARIVKRHHGKLIVLPLFHPQDAYHHFTALYRPLMQADAILAQTPYSAALMKHWWPHSNPRVTGAGVDLEEFANSHVSGARFRARWGLQGLRIVLLVGRKEYFKRYALAIEAVEALADKSVRLVIVGRDVDKLPIQSAYVSYLGELPRAELLDAYDACDLFVLPSVFESFGMVFLEAWARRKAVIGSRLCPSSATLIREGVNGLLACGAWELAGAIRTLLAAPEQARAMGEAGYALVAREFTWQATARRVADINREVLRAGAESTTPQT